MSKKNTVYFTGGKEATLAITADHKRKGRSIVRIYPVQFNAKSREPLPFSHYNKEDALVTLDFENVQALDKLLDFLDGVRDNALNGGPEAVIIEHGIGFESMPEKILAHFAEGIHKEQLRRASLNKEKSPEENGKVREPEVVNQQ